MILLVLVAMATRNGPKGVFFTLAMCPNMWPFVLEVWSFTPRGPLVFQAGYHPRKRTFKTHPKHIFSGMKIDPKYAFLHAFFLFCSSCPFQTFVTMTKNTPFFPPILHVFAPLNNVCAHTAWSRKTTLIM